MKVVTAEILYLFKSERLGFRVWKKSDLAYYIAMNSDDEVMRYFPKEFRPDALGSAQSIERFMDHYNKYGYTYFAVDYIENNEFIGFLGMKTISYEAFFSPGVDIGWRFRKEYWGRGLATEGAIASRDYFFSNFDVGRLISLTPLQNQPSWNVMEKIGMKKIGTFNHPMIENEDPLAEHVVYELLNK